MPVSTSALAWAVAESGVPKADLEKRLKVASGTVERWIDGDCQPNGTQFKRLKLLLKRPASIFFMETPPISPEAEVAMRLAFGATSRSRSPNERLAIRDATRVRKFVGDLWEELREQYKGIPSASTNEDPEEVANTVRSEILGVGIQEQLAWSSPSQAFRKWRALIERMHILVFLYPLGELSARGFSCASDHPPVIGVSTTWHPSIRVYTLFHELGHVLTRTSSSCVEATTGVPTEDPVERWCERFSASLLMPGQAVRELIERHGSLDAIATATWLANKLCVSRKAALLRLVEIGDATWSDFRRLDSKFERKGGGGRPDADYARTRDIVRRDTYGGCLSGVMDAYQSGLVTEADIRSYLRMSPEELA
ncbi:MAG: ImmA/IrrE family metallo-endopeptidase [Candidatus Dadabacteria bacterium]|nr:ImmA/IrrE family metallo-endopeptidase [Candidatus Dadabacteria bacterium]